MDTKESKIVSELILNDLKYIAVRSLYFNWFFNSGSEIANQLLDSTIKLYLKSKGRLDLVKVIIRWGGNESHNVLKIINLCVKEFNLDFDFNEHREALDTIYKTYQVRYLDNLERIGEIRGFLKYISTVDYSYKYFRDKINISEHGRMNTLINKLLSGSDLGWGEDNISLKAILLRENRYFTLVA
jgi:hypothetical protein